jgi:hypothetical protein
LEPDPYSNFPKNWNHPKASHGFCRVLFGLSSPPGELDLSAQETLTVEDTFRLDLKMMMLVYVNELFMTRPEAGWAPPETVPLAGVPISREPSPTTLVEAIFSKPA